LRSGNVITDTEILNGIVNGFSLFVTTASRSLGLDFDTGIILQYGFDSNCNIQVAMHVGGHRFACRGMTGRIWSNWGYFNINT
jgi:hypothetical protein